MADEELEQTLCVIKECYVYKIPPLKSATGHRASDWNVEGGGCLWSGRLQVVQKGQKCLIKLINTNDGNVFAECVATDRSVEPVKDSSRYFVLTLEDGQGRRAFIGLGFTERNEAFDFNAALADHKKYLRQLQEAEKAGQYWATQPKLDFSIPQGQSIHVNLKSKSSAPVSSQREVEGSGPVLLAPPPGTRSRTQQQHTPAQSTGTTQFMNDASMWSDFTGPSISASNPFMQSTPQQPPQQPQQQNWNPFL
eukprot:TRINITY_DN6478_c0_g1_i1.p1 TRINITY_DN6478_c0_g1~~TRINITY_DN6478_c0_g1_i1.p1  ORF type:complete len:251 (-),score=91.04 TRINITY_DN6478_c0_g1_i1:52-804(-)